MENIEILRLRKSELEQELQRITVKKHGDTPWNSGVQDQFKSNSYSYEQYTDANKANNLKAEIRSIENKIRNLVNQNQQKEERQKIYNDLRTPKHDYKAAGHKETTKDPAIAARYNAQQRFFGMNKLQQTMMKVTGQKKKFETLWRKAALATSQVEKQQIAEELDGMFKGR